VNEGAAIKCDGEGDDDDAMRRLGSLSSSISDHVKHGEWIKAA
jgi:hypothetical protein